MLVDREVIGYAVALADATRRPGYHGLQDLEAVRRVRREPAWPDRPRPGRPRAGLLRGRGHVVAEDVRDLALDVLRHRLVLSYDALAEGVTADDVLEQVLAAVDMPHLDLSRGEVAA